MRSVFANLGIVFFESEAIGNKPITHWDWDGYGPAPVILCAAAKEVIHMAKGQRDDHPGTAWSASGEGRIVIGHKESGEPIFRYLSTKMQKELLKKLHQNIEEYRDVDLSENSRMPLGQWLDRWLEEYAAPPHWKATRAISSAASSLTWETSRWENLPWRMCENSTGNCKRIEEWRNIRFTVTACPVLWSAVSTGYSIRPWRRRCGKT